MRRDTRSESGRWRVSESYCGLRAARSPLTLRYGPTSSWGTPTLHLELHLPEALAAAHPEDSLLRGPLEETNDAYAIAKISGTTSTRRTRTSARAHPQFHEAE